MVRRKHKRNAKLVILGNYQPDINPYHREVIDAASDEVTFLGAIYDARTVNALRYFARVYVHGHQVGGTNPSLVEAIGAGNAVLARDNIFNRWVAKDGAIYFDDIRSATKAIDNLFSNEELMRVLRTNSRNNYQINYRWEYILNDYEKLLNTWLPG